jgi:hypothetical protein
MIEARAASDADIRQLFEVPPARFVAARTELVGSLKAQGERERAAAIARVRRPSVTAWALDRLVEDAPEALDELFAANDALRAAMGDTGSRAGARFREAAGARQRVVAALAARAGAFLEHAGAPATRVNIDRIVGTLMATAADPEGADLLRRGVLDHDLSAGGGFEVAFGAAGPAPPGTGTSDRREAPDRAASARAARRRERAERDAERAAQAATAAARAAAAAERDAAEAERDAEAAAKVAAGKRRAAGKARREADRAAERARSAARRLTEADGPTRP